MGYMFFSGLCFIVVLNLGRRHSYEKIGGFRSAFDHVV